MIYQWLSFADPTAPKGTQFIGCAIVIADDFETAMRESRRLGCNPGGEAMGVAVENDPRDPNCIGVLFRGKAGAEELAQRCEGSDYQGVITTGELKDRGADVEGNISGKACKNCNEDNAS